MASASEKLRGLLAQANGPQTYCPEPREYEDATDSVMAALPLIADVVEAAEVYAPVIWRRDASDGHTLNGIELRRRLTALREHLEGSGDD